MKLTVVRKDVPLKLPYSYARGDDLTCPLVRVRLTTDDATGWGEGAPFESFFARPASETVQQLEDLGTELSDELTAEDVLELLPPGPARNALDAALWDLRAKQRGLPVWQLLCLDQPAPVSILTTISLAGPGQLEQELRDSAGHPVLKLKLGADDDVRRLELTRQLRPDAELVVDVNGGWDFARLVAMLPMLTEYGVRMIEQPVKEADESRLAECSSDIPLVADESFGTEADLDWVVTYYDGINIKLDKCGGLTAGLRIVEKAKNLGLRIMVGCLPASSLSTAVGFHLAQLAEFVDLDNHLWLAEDTNPPVEHRAGRLSVPPPELWG
ncbi:dipeptide epimerase [Amycolatopsis anabasis]|uniref:dipeptide epimerase n=1 Tax=Amycolatopsis anabasis TaxID=1840409 RepID=UPI00131EB515|nr:dipeptide epimerase [Amycolatopsis anabasis]